MHQSPVRGASNSALAGHRTVGGALRLGDPSALRSGPGTCTLACPSGVKSCIPKPWIAVAGVYALMFDGMGNVWAVTDGAGSRVPASTTRPKAALSPVMELQIGAR